MVLWMDVCKIEPPGAVTLRKTTEESLRPPLGPSEKNNAAPVSRKPRTREVSSRYKSGITPITIPPLSTPAASQRCPSPSVSRMALSPTPALPKRSQSAERRRPSTPPSRASAPSSPSKPKALSSPSSRPSTPVHDVTLDLQLLSRRLGGGRVPDGLWPSMRSLSTSFSAESVSVSHGKRDKPVSNSNVAPDHNLKSSANFKPERKRAPSRGKNAFDQSESPKPLENLHTRLAEQHRWPGVMSGKFSARAMSRSVDLTDRACGVSTSPGSKRGLSPTRRPHISDGSSRGFQKTENEVTRRMSLDGSGRLELEFSNATTGSGNLLERSPSWSHPSRTLSLPLAGSPCPSSPSKSSLTSTSSSRSMSSPSRSRPSTPTSFNASAGRIGISSSVLSYFVNLRKGKKGASHIEDAHQLRLLDNRYLQWRFVNARADTALSIQKTTIESILYSVWITISDLCDSVIMKRIDMQQLRQEMKLDFILKDQMTCLEDWALLEKEHCNSLLGAIEALKASTLRLPVTGGARADNNAVKDAISSAVDVMQSMGSSICQLLSGVEETDFAVSELSAVAARERAMLDESRELLGLTAAMQVQECSLRTHLLQLRQDGIRQMAPNSRYG